MLFFNYYGKYRKKLLSITKKIVKEYQPEKVILFGSYAWGTPHAESDIDLFLVKKSGERRIERERDVQRILWGSNMPIDTIVYTPQEVQKRLDVGDFFIEKIVRDGKILYAE